jgi:Protein of unknown function (DUF3574)
MPFAVICTLIPLLTACDPPGCQRGSGQIMQTYTLYFGRSVAARGEVSDKEWREFRDQVITPALPDGYTVLDGQGAWMNPRSHATVLEATKILVVALPDSHLGPTSINRIRSAWQHRFHQYVVGMTVQSGCGSFSTSEAPP